MTKLYIDISNDFTQCGPKVLEMIFLKNRRHMMWTHNFFIQNKLHWHTYSLFRGRIVSEKLPKIPLVGPSLRHRLRLLGSQQHPQSGVLLTSFSTWGTENSLAEINLEGTGVIKGCNIFCGSKIGKHLQLCGRVHYRATRKNLDSRTQLDEPVECVSGDDPLLLYKIMHVLFFLLVRILCALRLESRKNYLHGLDAGFWNFSFFG
jgi:hypothetical protein